MRLSSRIGSGLRGRASADVVVRLGALYGGESVVASEISSRLSTSTNNGSKFILAQQTSLLLVICYKAKGATD